MENESSIKQMINNSMQQIRQIMDADTVVGQPIKLDNGVTILPFSRVSLGFASGGLDLPARQDKARKNFGGAGGTGVTVNPIGFLVTYPDGKVAPHHGARGGRSAGTDCGDPQPCAGGCRQTAGAV